MRGARVGLLINAGFRAVQETQGQARDGNLFDYFYQKPVAIAPQSRTREIAGRIDHAGAELRPARRSRGAHGRGGAQGTRASLRSRSAICSPT